MSLCDTSSSNYISVIKSSKYECSEKDRNKVIYSFSDKNSLISVLISEAIYQATNSPEAYSISVPNVNTNGITFNYTNGDSVYINISILPPQIEENPGNIITVMTGGPVYVGTFSKNSVDYDLSYDSGTNILTIELSSGGSTINILTIDFTPGPGSSQIILQ